MEILLKENMEKQKSMILFCHFIQILSKISVEVLKVLGIARLKQDHIFHENYTKCGIPKKFCAIEESWNGQFQNWLCLLWL